MLKKIMYTTIFILGMGFVTIGAYVSMDYIADKIIESQTEEARLRRDSITNKNNELIASVDRMIAELKRRSEFDSVSNAVASAVSHDQYLSLQRVHRFYQMTPNQVRLAVKEDRKNREHSISTWSLSFEKLCTTIEWPFLDTLYSKYKSAKVISVMEADTIGIFSGEKPKQLSILPLQEDEYILSVGKNETAAAYYKEDQNLIVLRYDYREWDTQFSYENGRLIFHELCHEYLKKYKWNDKREHAWIRIKEKELFSRLMDVYCMDKDSTLNAFNVPMFASEYFIPEVDSLKQDSL